MFNVKDVDLPRHAELYLIDTHMYMYFTHVYVFLIKMTDVPKHVWKIKESCYVYTTIYIVAAMETFWTYVFASHV